MEEPFDVDPNSPIYKAMTIIKENDLIEQAWLMLCMNRIAHRFIDLNSLETVMHTPDSMHPTKIRTYFETCVDEYVKMHIEKLRAN